MAVVGLVAGAIVWTVLFPIRFVFKLAVGLAVAGIGLVLVPVVILVAGVVVVAALAAVAMVTLVPLLPLLALALIAWAAYKAVARRPSPAI